MKYLSFSSFTFELTDRPLNRTLLKPARPMPETPTHVLWYCSGMWRFFHKMRQGIFLVDIIAPRTISSHSSPNASISRWTGHQPPDNPNQSTRHEQISADRQTAGTRGAPIGRRPVLLLACLGSSPRFLLPITGRILSISHLEVESCHQRLGIRGELGQWSVRSHLVDLGEI